MEDGDFTGQEKEEGRGRTRRSKFRQYYDEEYTLEDEEDLQHRKKKSGKRAHRPRGGGDEYPNAFDDQQRMTPGRGGKGSSGKNRR